MINIDHFVPIRDFKESIDRLIRKMRTCPPAKGFDRVMLPGEPEVRTMKNRIRTGIPLEDNVWDDLVESARELDVSVRDV